MTEIIGVTFKKNGKVYYFDPQGIECSYGAGVVVETSRGLEYGTVTISNRAVSEEKINKPLKPIVRLATKDDDKRAADNVRKAEDAFSVCQKKIEDRKLDMKLVDVEYAFDGSKLMFYFTADGRIDFRELVKDLASVFRTRIELRQIGVRDEAKMLGGVGICGKSLCCATFLSDFQPVSIKMVKEQSLSLNPTKISGNCGRLMCCLKYEHEAYDYLLKETPRAGSVVITPEGRGVVSDVSLLRGILKVRLDSNPDSPPHSFDKRDVKLLKPLRVSIKTESNDEGPTKEDTETAALPTETTALPQQISDDKKAPSKQENVSNNYQRRDRGDRGAAVQQRSRNIAQSDPENTKNVAMLPENAANDSRQNTQEKKNKNRSRQRRRRPNRPHTEPQSPPTVDN